MAMVTIVISDDDTLKCGFRSQAFTGESTNQDSPQKSHVMAAHIMNWLKQEEGAIARPQPEVKEEVEDSEEE